MSIDCQIDSLKKCVYCFYVLDHLLAYAQTESVHCWDSSFMMILLVFLR